MSAKVVTVSDAEFEQTVLKSDKPVMLDFWAEWCQPCKMLTPTIEELAGDFEDQVFVGKLNVDDNPNMVSVVFRLCFSSRMGRWCNRLLV